MRRKREVRKGTPVPQMFEDASPNQIGKRGEKNLRKATGCVLTPGSGAGKTKGDGLHGFKRMIEKKTTSGKTMTVRRDSLEKLVTQAFEARREPVYVIEFLPITPQTRDEQWAMVPLDRLMELYEIEERLDKDSAT